MSRLSSSSKAVMSCQSLITWYSNRLVALGDLNDPTIAKTSSVDHVLIYSQESQCLSHINLFHIIETLRYSTTFLRALKVLVFHTFSIATIFFMELTWVSDCFLQAYPHHINHVMASGSQISLYLQIRRSVAKIRSHRFPASIVWTTPQLNHLPWQLSTLLPYYLLWWMTTLLITTISTNILKMI